MNAQQSGCKLWLHTEAGKARGYLLRRVCKCSLIRNQALAWLAADSPQSFVITLLRSVIHVDLPGEFGQRFSQPSPLAEPSSRNCFYDNPMNKDFVVETYRKSEKRQIGIAYLKLAPGGKKRKLDHPCVERVLCILWLS